VLSPGTCSVSGFVGFLIFRCTAVFNIFVEVKARWLAESDFIFQMNNIERDISGSAVGSIHDVTSEPVLSY
jgi:hypothetical protein